MLRSYLAKTTGLSRAQVTRLIGQYLATGKVEEKGYLRRRFPSRYTRRDIESLLRDYAIEDRTTLRDLHQTLLTLDLLENRTVEARKEVAIVRDLEDRPAFKLMSVLFQEALLDSGWPKRDPQEFLRRFSAALNRLPWNVVGERAKARKANFEKRPPANQNPPVDTPNAPAVQKTEQVDLSTARTLANSRYQLAIETPLKDQAIEAFAAYIAAHKGAKPTPDIWPARSVTLHAGGASPNSAQCRRISAHSNSVRSGSTAVRTS